MPSERPAAITLGSPFNHPILCRNGMVWRLWVTLLSGVIPATSSALPMQAPTTTPMGGSGTGVAPLPEPEVVEDRRRVADGTVQVRKYTKGTFLGKVGVARPLAKRSSSKTRSVPFFAVRIHCATVRPVIAVSLALRVHGSTVILAFARFVHLARIGGVTASCCERLHAPFKGAPFLTSCCRWQL